MREEKKGRKRRHAVCKGFGRAGARHLLVINNVVFSLQLHQHGVYCALQVLAGLDVVGLACGAHGITKELAGRSQVGNLPSEESVRADKGGSSVCPSQETQPQPLPTTDIPHLPDRQSDSPALPLQRMPCAKVHERAVSAAAKAPPTLDRCRPQPQRPWKHMR